MAYIDLQDKRGAKAPPDTRENQKETDPPEGGRGLSLLILEGPMTDTYRPSMATFGRLGGLTRAAKYTTAELGDQCRRGWDRRFLRLVPDDVTDPATRSRMAAAAKSLYFARNAIKANATRAAKKAARAEAVARIVGAKPGVRS
jgi:predicted secreted protein